MPVGWCTDGSQALAHDGGDCVRVRRHWRCTGDKSARHVAQHRHCCVASSRPTPSLGGKREPSWAIAHSSATVPFCAGGIDHHVVPQRAGEPGRHCLLHRSVWLLWRVGLWSAARRPPWLLCQSHSYRGPVLFNQRGCCPMSAALVHPSGTHRHLHRLAAAAIASHWRSSRRRWPRGLPHTHAVVVVGVIFGGGRTRQVPPCDLDRSCRLQLAALDADAASVDLDGRRAPLLKWDC